MWKLLIVLRVVFCFASLLLYVFRLFAYTWNFKNWKQYVRSAITFYFQWIFLISTFRSDDTPFVNEIHVRWSLITRPKFFATDPNFEGLSRKNTRSFGTLNCPEFVPIYLTSRCVAVQLAVDQNAVDHFDILIACQRCVLLSSKRTRSIFSRGSAPYLLGSLGHSP